MPTFDTPEWIDLSVEVPAGSIQVDAGDHRHTEVEVTPARPGRLADEEAAQRTTVACEGGRVSVLGEVVQRGPWGWFGAGGAVRVRVVLPEGSQVRIATGDGDIHLVGRLGDLRAESSDGDILVGHAAACRLRARDGDVVVERAGSVEASTHDGDVRIGHVDGAVVAKTSDGDCRVTRAGGPVEARSSNGDVRVEYAGADVLAHSGDGDVHVGTAAGSVDVRTGDGDCHLGEATGTIRLRTADGDLLVERCDGDLEAVTSDGDISVRYAAAGTLRLATSDGDITIGVPHGTAAWLDLDARSGKVRNGLHEAGGPQDDDRVLQVHARTSDGHILVERA